jgi:hypothetical protein
VASPSTFAQDPERNRRVTSGEWGETMNAKDAAGPAEVGCREVIVSGGPNPKHISTSFVERQNLTM